MATTDADEDAREEAEGEEMMLRFGKHFPTYLSGFDKASRPGKRTILRFTFVATAVGLGSVSNVFDFS